jgi:hypothetical protein
MNPSKTNTMSRPDSNGSSDTALEVDWRTSVGYSRIHAIYTTASGISPHTSRANRSGRNSDFSKYK